MARVEDVADKNEQGHGEYSLVWAGSRSSIVAADMGCLS